MNTKSPVWIFLASGPSQHASDIELVRKIREHVTVVAINNQIFAAPWADILYTCDSSWLRHYDDRIQSTARRISPDVPAAQFGARVIAMEAGDGLGRSAIRSGNNSGYQALNYGFLCGMRHAILLGYDMKWSADGKRHNHADHPSPLGNFGVPTMCQRKFPALAKDLAAEGVSVINASRETALDCFPRAPLRVALGTTARNSGFTFER